MDSAFHITGETAWTPPERRRLGDKLLAAFIAIFSLVVLDQAVHNPVTALGISVPPALVGTQAILATLGMFAAWAIWRAARGDLEFMPLGPSCSLLWTPTAHSFLFRTSWRSTGLT